MSECTPTVSIGMPVYNGEQFLRLSLDALQAQDFEDFELVISDNASTDATPDICAEYAARDPRIRYSANEANIGAIRNFERVRDLCAGKYFMWASCHDLWEPTFVSTCVDVMERHPSVVVCYPVADWIDLANQRSEVIPCTLETRGLDLASRVQVVLWGLQYCYPIYGLIRGDAARQLTLDRLIVGPDMLALFELSLLGDFAMVPETLLHIRRMPNHGDWAALVERSLNTTLTPANARRLYWRMVAEHLRIVHRRLRRLSRKLMLDLLVLFCMLTKYRYIRTDLARAAQREADLCP